MGACMLSELIHTLSHEYHVSWAHSLAHPTA